MGKHLDARCVLRSISAWILIVVGLTLMFGGNAWIIVAVGGLIVGLLIMCVCRSCRCPYAQFLKDGGQNHE